MIFSHNIKLLILLLLLNICFTGNAPSQWTGGVLHSFNGNDGATSKGSLTLFGNTLYGRTSAGGANGEGVIFKVDTDSTGFQVLYNFQTGSSNGLGKEPHHDAMLYYDEFLYGTALEGGNSDNGVIYKLNLSGTEYTPIHIFTGGNNDGAQPHSGVIEINNVLYGMTAAGGTHGNGTLYSIDPDGSNFNVLYSFHNSDGDNSHGRLTLGSDGHTLFGMTREGGSQDLGVIFSFDLNNSNYTILHSFAGGSKDGSTTDHGFLTRSNDTLFGMTQLGGSGNTGIIFSIKENGSDFQIMHSFGSSSTDGTSPYGSLQLSNGFLYGTTRTGGDHDHGSVFRINTSGTTYEILYSLKRNSFGEYPIDNVVLNTDGTELYCLAQAGGEFDSSGSNQYGTVFELNTLGIIGINNASSIVPENFKLSQNFPNPFNPSTVIKYELNRSAFVSLKVTNVKGQEVRTLENSLRSSGEHSVEFEAGDLPAGIYFYTLESNGLTQTKKLLLLK
ncbi:MAG: choice-of-anchor tandem repeat GloVer-containing protein [bacterium]